MHEDLFTQVYTWYSKHNTTKKKKRLPKPMQDAIMHVGRIAIKGVPGVTEAQLEAAFRARFSSYNSKKRKLERKKKVRHCRLCILSHNSVALTFPPVSFFSFRKMLLRSLPIPSPTRIQRRL